MSWVRRWNFPSQVAGGYRGDQSTVLPAGVASRVFVGGVHNCHHHHVVLVCGTGVGTALGGYSVECGCGLRRQVLRGRDLHPRGGEVTTLFVFWPAIRRRWAREKGAYRSGSQ